MPDRPSASPRFEPHLALRANDAAYSAFESAGVQVMRLVTMLEDPANPLDRSAGGKPDAEWFAEVFRRMLEFLNAAHSVAGHCEAMAPKDLTLHGEVCALREAVFAGSPLARFMEEIRTCMQHRPVPPMMLADGSSPAQFRVLRLSVADMPSWPHWSPPARQFLHQHLPALPLRALLHDYQQMVRMFRQRAVRGFREVFAAEIAAAPPPPPPLMTFS